MTNTAAHIELDSVAVDFPVFNSTTRSLKNRVINSVTGGLINENRDGVLVVRGLQHISLSLRKGDRLGIIGHNGSGKTTLLRVLSGIYHPTEGHATIQGQAVSLINISLGIDADATGRENIRLRSALMGLTPSATKAIAQEVIEFSGLGDFIDLPVRTYSTGMQLRLAFAVSTQISPQILIMDEWLSTGDEEFKVRAEQRLQEVINKTDILILASHSRSLIESHCNRILWLEHGKIKMYGAPEDILGLYFGN